MSKTGHTNMKPIGRIFRYLRFFKAEVILNVVFNALAVVFNLFSFVMIIPFVELFFGLTDPPTTEPTLAFNQQALTDWLTYHLYVYKDLLGAGRCLLIVALGYIVAVLLSNLCRYLGMFFLSPIRNGIIERLRNDIYHRITILPISFFNNQRKGDIISRLSNDLTDVEWSIVCALQSLIKDPINIILFTATLIFTSTKLFCCFVIMLPLFIYLIGRIGKSLRRNSFKGQTLLGQLFAKIEESLSAVKIIKGFGQEDRKVAEFQQANRQYSDTMIKVARRRELSSPLSEIIGTLALVLILLLGGSLTFAGDMRPSVFIFFVIIFARLIPPIQAVVKAYNSLQKGSASATRIFEIIDADECIVQRPDALVIDTFNNKVEYRNVSFAYHDASTERPALTDISFTLHKGQYIALVGPSGAGKSTIADLLPRFYDPQQGCVLLDGHDLRSLDIDALRRQSAIVSQSCILFNDSVANNIAYGNATATPEQIRHAARVAYADDFISRLPQGYDTPIGDRGVTLSGGQRQRLSIARAVLKDAPILILDEATSALDSDAEHQVQLALEQLLAGRTALVIAHRLSTIQHANEILVLKEGRIVERGTHFSLLARNGEYKRMVDLQQFE